MHSVDSGPRSFFILESRPSSSSHPPRKTNAHSGQNCSNPGRIGGSAGKALFACHFDTFCPARYKLEIPGRMRAYGLFAWFGPPRAKMG